MSLCFIRGPIRFLVFYLICGLAAGFLQIAVTPNSTVPNLGASAIADVLGGFQIVFPRDRILAAMPTVTMDRAR